MTRATKSAIAGAVLVLALAAVGAVLLFGRGGSTASAQTPAGQQGGGPANSANFQQFRQCMADNGATLSPGQRPNMSDPTFQKARQACAQYAPQRPSGGFRGGGGFGQQPNGSVAPGQSGAST
jgi:hypothetical protein